MLVSAGEVSSLVGWSSEMGVGTSRAKGPTHLNCGHSWVGLDCD